MTNDEIFKMLYDDFEHACDQMNLREQEFNEEVIYFVLRPLMRKLAVRLVYGRSKPM